MLDRITSLVNETLCLAHPLSTAQVADLIDSGASTGGRTGRHWVLDPIDGTRGFVGRRQYAVCLGLIEAGEVTMGVLGCPNLPLAVPVDQPSLDAEAAGRDAPGAQHASGCLFHAVRGGGAFVAALAGEGAAAAPSRIHAQTDPTGAAAVYMTSWESRHSNHDLTDRLASGVGVTRPALKLDSQAKYGERTRVLVSALLVWETGGILTPSVDREWVLPRAPEPTSTRTGLDRKGRTPGLVAGGIDRCTAATRRRISSLLRPTLPLRCPPSHDPFRPAGQGGRLHLPAYARARVSGEGVGPRCGGRAGH